MKNYYSLLVKQNLANKQALLVFIQIQETQTVELAWEAIMEPSDHLAMLGSIRHVRSLEKRDSMVESAINFYVESRLQDPLDQ